jgi:hypothetical protein
MRSGSNPHAVQKRWLPHKAFLMRDDPLRPIEEQEIAEACRRVAKGALWMVYAGSREPEQGCRVFCFDRPDVARAMQVWIEVSGIERRPRPAPAPNIGLLRIG